MSSACSLLAVLLIAAEPTAAERRYFEIEVVDAETKRGVPLVELRTVNEVRYVTDSRGIVAFCEPGLMDRKVFFHIHSHGYEFPADGFGQRGRDLYTGPGGSARVEIKRINVAERLYRATGAGIYRDSVLTGRQVPIRRPLLNGQVLGSDSVLNAVFRGKIYWFWGDTNRPGYPLGNFHVPGATSLLPEHGGLAPGVGVDLDYFVGEDGFANETARMPGDGPTWITALVTLDDADGNERLLAGYVKIRNSLEVYRRGLAEFDPVTERFEQVAEVDLDAPIFSSGHALKHTVDGVEYVYFADPFPLVRVRADAEDFLHPDRYEAFTWQKIEGGQGPGRYAWRKEVPPLTQQEEAQLIEDGRIAAERARFQLRDRRTGKPVVAHRASVYFNDYRNRFVMIFTEQGGSSYLGEVWYAEADSPEGPWTEATKIATHDNYSFYNPKQHPMFDEQGGRVIYFEGTYTATFSGNPRKTPRYDYNQIMYRLDLADPRLGLEPPAGRP